MPLIGRLCAFVRSPDDNENRTVIPSLTSSLLAILQMLTPSTYDWFLKFLQNSNISLQMFLTELFGMLLLITKSVDVYPKPWIQFKLQASVTILGKVVKMIYSGSFGVKFFCLKKYWPKIVVLWWSKTVFAAHQMLKFLKTLYYNNEC